MKNSIVRTLTLTQLGIRHAVIMSISLAMFLFAACDSNAPSGPQDLNGSLSDATTLSNSAVPLDTASSFAVQAPVSLGLTDGFAILSYAGITNTGPTSITGYVGASPITGASMTGFGTVALVGTIYTVDAAGPTGYVTNSTMLTQAMGDLTTAYNDAAGRTVNPIGVAGNLGGRTLPPGLYKSTSSLEISSGDLMLDAQGDANAVWIFQIASSFNMTSGRQVILIGGAKASNIFWQVGSSATFGTTAKMNGTIMAYATITFATGASLEGRALARTASVTLDANTVGLSQSPVSFDANTVRLSKSAVSLDAASSFAVQAPVNLGTAGNYVILAKSGISTTGTTSIVGDIGVSPIAATAITGFGLILNSLNQFSTSSLVSGKVYAADYAVPTPAKMTTAVLDMQTAYTNAAGRSLPNATELGAGNINGMTLVPGLYKWGTVVTIPSRVTLAGGANDVWIFQIAQGLTVGNGAIVTLSGGAQAKNIFWQVAGQVTLGTTSDFKGIILCKTAIVLNTGAKLRGRALAQTAVTLIANAIVKPTW